MAKGLFPKKCPRKIVNCYRRFAELREALAGQGHRGDSFKRSRPQTPSTASSIVLQFLFEANDLSEVTPKASSICEMKLKDLSEGPQQRELCVLTNTQS